MSINTLREKYATLSTELRSLVKSVEGRDYTSDEDAKYIKLSADIDALSTKIEREVRASKLDIESIPDEAKAVDMPKSEAETVSEDEHRSALMDWIKNDNKMSARGISDTTRKTLAKLEKRAQLIGTANLGGNLLIDEWDRKIIKTMKAFGGLLELADEIPTTTGAPLHFTTTNYTSQEGEWLGEIDAKTNLDVTFERFTMGAYGLSSKGVRIGYDLIQDESFNIESELLDVCARRSALSLAKRLVTGTGSSQMHGVLASTGATEKKTTAGVAAVTADEILEFIHELNPAYRNPGAYLVFNDKTLLAIRKFKDSNNNPIWNMGIPGSMPATIWGVPYRIVHEIADMATGAKFMLYGDFKKFRVRRVKSNQLLKDEFPSTRELEFYLHSRWDSRVLDRDAIIYMKNA